MALTRAQLLMGNTAQGIVLTDQVQGVREAIPPDGITIDPDGTIHFDAATSVGTVKLNNPTGFNGYVWPNAPGTPGQQLEIGTGNNLFWADADGIDWTMKGQLIVGTGFGPTMDTLLDPGPNNWVLKTNSATTSGLEWSQLYVDVVPNITGAAVIPTGTTAQRPPAPLSGYFRMNEDFVQPNRLEVWDSDGNLWRQIAYIEPIPGLAPLAIASNTSLAGAVYCSDFIVSPGATLTVEGALLVFCTGNVDIGGTITANALGPTGARRFGAGVAPGSLYPLANGAGLGPGYSRFGGSIYNIAVSPTGSGGGNGFAANPTLNVQSFTAAEGGDGGGSIIIRCLNDINVTGIITADGGSAIAPIPNNCWVAGGGGGSGGSIVLDASRNLTLNGASITANGGNGSAGGNQAGGGGGGGGGYIITQARFGVLNIIGATSRIANGGSAGPASGVPSVAGAGGGGNAGAGGFGQNAAQAATNGGIGQVSNFGSIYSLPSG